MQSKISKTTFSISQLAFLFMVLVVGSSFSSANAKTETEPKTNSKMEVQEAHTVKQVTKVGKNTKEVTKSSASDKEDISIECINPNAACKEAKVVISTLMKISEAYSHGDFDSFGSYLDDEVTILDKKTKKVIVGKKAVLADVKKRWEKAHVGPSPVLSFTIEHPYAKVMGNTAVVTFKAVKVIGGGKKPQTYVSKSTDIFVKKEGKWKKLHYISDWKKAKS